MRRIILLSTQRSGSTMVCDDLAGAEVFGRPSEYFIRVLEKGDEVLSEDFATVDKQGRTENNVTSVKIMANQVEKIGCAIVKAGLSKKAQPLAAFVDYFQQAFLVRIYRRDKVAQAVSRIMALETDVYHIASNAEGLEGMLGKLGKVQLGVNAEYSAPIIKAEIDKICDEEKLLDELLASFSRPAKTLVYEEIIEDRAYVQAVADELDITQFSLRLRRLEKMGGSLSRDWIDRYKAGLKT